MFSEKQGKIERGKEKIVRIDRGDRRDELIREVKNRRRNGMMAKYIIDYYGIITRRKID